MPLNVSVAAAVVDLRWDTPQAEDHFYVDTNVWYWLAYTRASQLTERVRRYQITDYPRYIQRCLRSGARLYSSGLSISELAHIIERSERELFSQGIEDVDTKSFRYNFPAERDRVVGEIQGVSSQVRSMSSVIETMVDERLLARAFGRMDRELLDGYDALVVARLLRTHDPQVITDDADFSTVPGITVFTSNFTIIDAARESGKLIRR